MTLSILKKRRKASGLTQMTEQTKVKIKIESMMERMMIHWMLSHKIWLNSVKWNLSRNKRRNQVFKKTLLKSNPYSKRKITMNLSWKTLFQGWRMRTVRRKMNHQRMILIKNKISLIRTKRGERRSIMYNLT